MPISCDGVGGSLSSSGSIVDLLSHSCSPLFLLLYYTPSPSIPALTVAGPIRAGSIMAGPGAQLPPISMVSLGQQAPLSSQSGMHVGRGSILQQKIASKKAAQSHTTTSAQQSVPALPVVTAAAPASVAYTPATDPKNFVKLLDEASGRYYYANATVEAVQWDPPDGWAN